MFQKLSCLTDKVSAICLVVIVGDADTIPKSVSELSRKKDRPFLASPNKFVFFGIQIKNYNLCYLQRTNSRANYGWCQSLF
jgi:hypothetical protein